MGNRFVTILSSSTKGDLERHPAPTRAKAFEAARELAIECLAREAEHQWLHGEVISIRVEGEIG
jgi:hypothetical protein